MTPVIRVDDEVMEALFKKVERHFRDTPNDVLRRLLGLEVAGSDGEGGGKRERGRFLAMPMYRQAILHVLGRRESGRASVPTVIKHVGDALRALLTPEDRKPLKSGMIRWENRVMWERLNMVKEGLLKDDSPRGVWEISSKGRAYLKREDMADEVAEFRSAKGQEQEEEPSED